MFLIYFYLNTLTDNHFFLFKVSYFLQVLLKIGQSTDFPKLTVEIESVLVRRLQKIQSKLRRVNNQNDNNSNSNIIFVSEENTNDQIVNQMESLGI